MCVIHTSIITFIISEMTSVLYGAGLNYQLGNPVRQEIVAVRRELDSLRKEVERLSDENELYRNYLTKLIKKEDCNINNFTEELMSVSTSSVKSSSKEPGGATVQGAGFRR